MFFHEISFVVRSGKPCRRSISWKQWLKVESVSTPVRLGFRRCPPGEHFADEVEVLLHPSMIPIVLPSGST